MKNLGPIKYTSSEPSGAVLNDAVSVWVPEAAAALVAERQAAIETVSVRTAKANLSALLDKVAAGGEVLITSDGRPKARLVPLEREASRKVFTGIPEHLKRIPWRGGPDATELVSEGREDRW